VRRLIIEVFNEGHLAALDELYEADAAARARTWIAPFRASFSDLTMDIVQLVAEDITVVGRFTHFGRHTGDWLGYPPTHGVSTACPRSTSSASRGTESAEPGDWKTRHDVCATSG